MSEIRQLQALLRQFADNGPAIAQEGVAARRVSIDDLTAKTVTEAEEITAGIIGAFSSPDIARALLGKQITKDITEIHDRNKAHREESARIILAQLPEDTSPRLYISLATVKSAGINPPIPSIMYPSQTQDSAWRMHKAEESPWQHTSTYSGLFPPIQIEPNGSFVYYIKPLEASDLIHPNNPLGLERQLQLTQAVVDMSRKLQQDNSRRNILEATFADFKSIEAIITRAQGRLS